MEWVGARDAARHPTLRSTTSNTELSSPSWQEGPGGEALPYTMREGKAEDGEGALVACYLSLSPALSKLY